MVENSDSLPPPMSAKNFGNLSMKPACPGPVTRRNFLKLGGLALASAGITPWKLQAVGPSDPTADNAVIFVWLPGGPPHMEMYDLKPDAPSEVRGEFEPVRTNVPGIDVSEHLPMHCRVADKFALIRSIAHTFADHGGGHKRFLTGRDPKQPTEFIVDGQRPTADRHVQLRLRVSRPQRASVLGSRRPGRGGLPNSEPPAHHAGRAARRSPGTAASTR
jgi:hypothetical protein